MLLQVILGRFMLNTMIILFIQYILFITLIVNNDLKINKYIDMKKRHRCIIIGCIYL